MADEIALKRARSGEKHLVGADLSGADLRWLDLSGANLEQANLYGADMSGVNLKDANLSGADVRKAILHCQFLREANLSAVIYDDTTAWPGCAKASWYVKSELA
jgi:uncharacterized protein YjbI with pentapeptide repeats